MPAPRPPTSARRTALAAVAVTAALLTACGGTDPSASDGDAAEAMPSETTSADPAPGPSETRSPSTRSSGDPGSSQPEPGTRIEVRIAEGEVEPRGERVKVAVGESVLVVIDSDVPGEMHVHATPEHEWAFPAGRSRYRIRLAQPGIADMELHDPPLTVVQLEAR